MPLDKALRALWESAGYDRKMGSTRVRRPPNPGFVPGYHLTSAAHAISAIALGRLKVARLSDLNDPFESMGVMWRELPKRKTLQKRKTEYDQHTGLLCFSRDWTNPVLWSHYGDKHRGICLGFDLLESEAKPVKYQEERLLDDPPAGSSLEEQILLTKFKDWCYESELRLFVPLHGTIEEGSLHFRPFDGSLILAEVILGDQCSVSLDMVRTLVAAGQPSAVTYRARLAGKSYNVVPDGETVP